MNMNNSKKNSKGNVMCMYHHIDCIRLLSYYKNDKKWLYKRRVEEERK